MIDKIYWLSTNVRFDDQLRYTSDMHLATALCAKHPEHAARSRWSRPIKVVGPIHPLTDFEWTVYGDILARRVVAESFARTGFSGVEFRNVQYFTSTETPFGRESLEFYAKGWGGVAPAASGIRVLEECRCCKRRVFSDYSNPEKLFDFDAWDGSDVFRIWPLPRYIMVTGRIRDWILDSQYTGVAVRSLTELPRGGAGTLSPGNLLDWFDEHKVNEIVRG